MKAASAQATQSAVAEQSAVASTSYWVLQGGSDLTEVRSVFRVRRDNKGAHVERFDPGTKGWLEGPASLLRYVIGGEVGADRVSRARAVKLANVLAASHQ